MFTLQDKFRITAMIEIDLLPVFCRVASLAFRPEPFLVLVVLFVTGDARRLQLPFGSLQPRFVAGIALGRDMFAG